MSGLMKKFTIYTTAGKPIEVIADDWHCTKTGLYVFTLSGSEIYSIDQNRFMGMKKEAI